MEVFLFGESLINCFKFIPPPPSLSHPPALSFSWSLPTHSKEEEEEEEVKNSSKRKRKVSKAAGLSEGKVGTFFLLVRCTTRREVLLCMYVITHTQSHTYIKYTYTHAQILHPHMAKGSLVERTERKKNKDKNTLSHKHTHTHMFYIFFLVDVVECSRGDGEKEVGGWC